MTYDVGRHGPSAGERGGLAGGDLFLRRIWRSTRSRWQRFVLLALAIWAVYSLALSPHGWLRMTALRRRADELRLELASLAASRDSLNLMVSRFDSSAEDLLEHRAREEFGFARPNERIYVLPRDVEDARLRAEEETRGGQRFTDRDPSRIRMKSALQ